MNKDKPIYKVILSDESQKIMDQIEKKDRKTFDLIREKLSKLQENPELGKKLTGDLSGNWSLRAADFRIIYRIDRTEIIVFVITIGNRRDVYE